MKKFENAKNVRLAVLASALRSDFVAGYEFSFVDRIADLTVKLPAKLEIVISAEGQDLEISEAALAGVPGALPVPVLPPQPCFTAPSQAPAAEGWVCGVCGHRNAPSGSFCVQCGSPRP
jgi:hypothetical protein